MYNNSMDRKSKIILYIFFFLFIGTIMFAYARYIIFRDFEIIRSENEASEPEAAGSSEDIGIPEKAPSL